MNSRARPKRQRPSVHGEYNRDGYEICVAGQLVYAAGNHIHDSSQPALCEQDRLPLATLRIFCIKTAREIARERRGVFVGVERVGEQPAFSSHRHTP
jgi:hypothetical protein